MQPLERVRIGRTGVEVTRFGLGCAPLGERFVPVSNSEADAIVETALAAGVAYFDTAPQYGQGKSEARLGRVLGTRPRQSYILSSKVGHLFEPPGDRAALDAAFAAGGRGNGSRFVCRSDYSRDGVLRSYEDSLQRLGLNRLDMLVIHDLDVGHHGAREVVDRHFRELLDGGGWRALEELKRSGDIRAIGCGINQLGQIPEMLGKGELDFFLVALPYTLLDQGALDEELPLCAEHGVAVVIGAVFASGILTGDQMVGGNYAYAAAPPQVRAKVDRMRQVAAAHGVDLKAAALQFPLFHPVVAAVIPGAYKAANVTENMANLAAEIPPAFWSALVGEGLLRADAPVPRA
jgi:D-threo-aldose 1-dehydrogenase